MFIINAIGPAIIGATLDSIITDGTGLFPCLEGLRAYWSDEWESDASELEDLAATGTHDADDGASLLFDGVGYGTVGLTGYTHLNAEVWTIEFEFNNSVAIDAATVAYQPLHIATSNAGAGVRLGSSSGVTTNEIIYIHDGANGVSAWTSATENIAIGKHTLSVRWSGTVYDIFLDGNKVNNTTSGTHGVLILDELYIGASGIATSILNNTSLNSLVLKNQAGIVIYSNKLAQGGTSTSIVSDYVDMPPVVLTGFTMANAWEDGVGGYDWGLEGFSENVTDGVELFNGIITDGVNLSVVSDTITCDTSGTANDNRAIIRSDTAFGGMVKFSFTVTSPATLSIFSAGAYGAATLYGVGTHTVTVVSSDTSVVVRSTVAGGVFNTLSIEEYYDGKIPQDPAIPTQDVLGNTLTNPGTGKRNMPVWGRTVGFDGATVGTLASAVTLSGDFKSEGVFTKTTAATAMSVFGGSGLAEGILYLFNATNIRLYIDSNSYSFTLETTDNTEYSYLVTRVGSVGTVTITDNATGISQTDTKTVSTADITVRFLGTYSAGSGIMSGQIPSVKFYNASNTLVNHWVMEGSNVDGYNQIIAYDVKGGNDATFSGYTLPLYDTLFQADGGTYLAREGGRLVENLLPNSEPIDLTEISSKGGVTVEAPTGDILTYAANVVVFGDNSTLRTAYQADDNTATSKVFSIYVEMDDGSTPVVTQSTGSGDDFNLVMNGLNTGITISSIENISGNVYKISGERASTGSNANYGVAKFTGNSNKSFKISRYHLTESNNEYVRTYVTPIVGNVIPKGATTDPLTFTGPHTDSPEGTFQWLLDYENPSLFDADEEVALPLELATNGDASDATYTDSSVHALVGFANYATHDATNKVTIGSGEFTLISDGTLTGLGLSMEVGKQYQISIDITGQTSGALDVVDSASGVITGLNSISAIGTYTINHTASGVGLYFRRDTGATNITFDNISLKEVGKQLHESDGTPRALDPHDYVAPDPLTLLLGTLGGVALSEEQTGDCLDETLEAIGSSI